jgi:hypothetical protein
MELTDDFLSWMHDPDLCTMICADSIELLLAVQWKVRFGLVADIRRNLLERLQRVHTSRSLHGRTSSAIE